MSVVCDGGAGRDGGGAEGVPGKAEPRGHPREGARAGMLLLSVAVCAPRFAMPGPDAASGAFRTRRSWRRARSAFPACPLARKERCNARCAELTWGVQQPGCCARRWSSWRGTCRRSARAGTFRSRRCRPVLCIILLVLALRGPCFAVVGAGIGFVMVMMAIVVWVPRARGGSQ
eukprot:3593243-Rhodomonas_salina.1